MSFCNSFERWRIINGFTNTKLLTYLKLFDVTSTEKFQETDSFIKDYHELKKYVFKKSWKLQREERIDNHCSRS